jgi:hypothetical protein
MISMNGRADLTYERLVDDQRFVERVLFDSVAFHDGVFFRRTWSGQTMWILPSGDTLEASSGFVTHGSYVGGEGVRVLRDYSKRSGIRVSVPAADSLALVRDTLVRRTFRRHHVTGEPFVWEERYQRIR